MTAERVRGNELAQLVTNHVLSDEYRDVLSPVVYRERMTDHRRKDSRGARPRANNRLLARGIEPVNLLDQFRVTVWTLLQRSRRITFSALR